MRALLATLLLCVCVVPAWADLVTIRASSGATARVAASHEDRFRCLIGKLEEAGYTIQFMGGHRAGACAPPRHKHPCGLALDINQTARNVVTRRLPSDTTAMAKACGLFHGALWGYADAGHFEVPTQRTARRGDANQEATFAQEEEEQ